VNDFEVYFTNSEFLNEIQRQTNIWIREVQRVTQLERGNVPIYSIIEEINYWKRMEESLNYIEKELKRTDICMCIFSWNFTRLFLSPTIA
jgi:hypothetical protein